MTALVKLEFENNETVLAAFNYSSFSELKKQVEILSPIRWSVVRKYI